MKNIHPVPGNEVTKSHPVNNEVKISDLVGNRASNLYLWTEKGALLHAKSLNTDKAWEVYDYLVALLPIEALDEMEKSFRGNTNRGIKLATTTILAEKMKRQLI